MKRFLILSSLTGLSSLATVQADTATLPPLVVSASRTALPASQIGASITEITAAQIKDSGVQFAADLLRQVPGLALSRLGGVGKQTQVRLRGAEANQVLVLIDGVEVNDPATGSEFDFAHLLSTDIERIEVIRGPQSALWGRDAMAGVINIITRKGAGQGINVAVSTGNQGTNQQSGGLSLAGQHYHLRLSGSRYHTDGTNVSEQGTEKDGYDNGTVSFNVEARPLPNLGLTGFVRHVQALNQFDPVSFITARPFDGNRESDLDQTYAGIHADLSLWDGHWDQRVAATFTDTNNDNRANGIGTSSNGGGKFKLDYQGTLSVTTSRFMQASHHLTLALEREITDFTQRGSASIFGDPNQDQNEANNGYVLEYRLGLMDRLFWQGAVRRDDNNRFKDVTTYHTSLAYLLPVTGTKLHAAYGEGLKNPSFTERFGFTPNTFFGNPNLRPETSRSWEIGIDQSLVDDALSVSVTYYRSWLKNEINGFVFDPGLGGFTARNMPGTSYRRGVETALHWSILPVLGLDVSYSWLDATQPDATGRQVREIRRPEHQGSVGLDYHFLAGRGDLNLRADYTGVRTDTDFSAFPFHDVALPSYVLVNLAGRYAFTPRLSVSGRIENLLDHHYEEVLGFAAKGFTLIAGLEYAIDL